MTTTLIAIYALISVLAAIAANNTINRNTVPKSDTFDIVFVLIIAACWPLLVASAVVLALWSSYEFKKMEAQFPSPPSCE